jgi:hypothetical protein
MGGLRVARHFRAILDPSPPANGEDPSVHDADRSEPRQVTKLVL